MAEGAAVAPTAYEIFREDIQQILAKLFQKLGLEETFTNISYEATSALMQTQVDITKKKIIGQCPRCA